MAQIQNVTQEMNHIIAQTKNIGQGLNHIK